MGSNIVFGIILIILCHERVKALQSPNFSDDVTHATLPTPSDYELDEVRTIELNHSTPKPLPAGHNLSGIGRNLGNLSNVISNNVEDISEFSKDSSDIDEQIRDVKITESQSFGMSAKFNEMMAKIDEARNIHTDESSKLPPFAFSTDEGKQETVVMIDGEIAVPTTVSTSTISLPITTSRPIPTERRSSREKKEDEGERMTVNVMNNGKRRISSESMSKSVELSDLMEYIDDLTTTTTTTSPKTTRAPLLFTTIINEVDRIRYEGKFRHSNDVNVSHRLSKYKQKETKLKTEFKRQQPGKHRGESGKQLKSTKKLLQLLGDKIEGIDQQHRHITKSRGLRHKQWGNSSSKPLGRIATTYDGYIGSLMKGGGYAMTKRMRLVHVGSNGASYMRYRTKKLTKDPVLRSSRNIETVLATTTEKSLAQVIMEGEKESMKQIKETLMNIRQLMNKSNMSKQKPPNSSSNKTKQLSSNSDRKLIEKLKVNRRHSSTFSGEFIN